MTDRRPQGLRVGLHRHLPLGTLEPMRTVGIVHRIDANAGLRTEVLEADGAHSVLEVMRAVYGPVLTVADLLDGNRLPDAPDDPAAVRSMPWDRWVALNPVTVLGARAFARCTGPTPVAVIAGPDSGFSISIDPDRPLLSRTVRPNSVCIVDPCLSRQATRLESDPSSHRPFSIAGATILLPGPTSDCAGTGDSAPATAEVIPAAVAEPRPARPPQWWAFLVPIAIGVVLAVVTGMWWFLLFSASAPLSGYVSHRMERRRFARDSAQCAADRQTALADARARLAELIDEHRIHLRTRPGLCLGFGHSLLPVTIAVDLQPGTDHLAGQIIVDDVPVRIDPLTTAVTVTGDYDPVRRMALSWLADRRWSWSLSHELGELPELQGTRCATGPRSADGVDSTHGTAADRRTASVGIALHRTVDGERATLQLDPPARKASVSLVVGGLARARVLTSTLAAGPVPGRELVATGMPPGRFITLEREQMADTDRDPFPSHGLGDHYDDAPETIDRRWLHSTIGPVTIGRGAAGDVTVDLFHGGPHALVAGTTGSGKSILLQTWLLAMAMENPPERLSFVLIDFKGGATFAPMASLPHTDCVLDDFDSAAAFRALVAVRAEITRRERLLADHGCADVLGLEDPPPRLVVVIDEFHALMASHPRAAELIEQLTALGRSLGVHLILATQRPLGVVTGHMKANINIRICLRVRDDADSFDVLGVTDAAHLPAAIPGAACLDSGTTITPFRVATPIGPTCPAEAVLRPRIRPWDPTRTVAAQSSRKGVAVENIVKAHRLRAHRSPNSARRVVLPPLPTNADLSGTAAASPGTRPGTSDPSDAMISGIVDEPHIQRQEEWTYRPDVDGSLLTVGADVHVVISVLARLAASAAATHRVVAVGRSADVLDWAEIRCGMEPGWRLLSILDHLGQPRTVPTLVVCGNWTELLDSLDHHTAGRLELLLRHASGLGLTFLIGGSRTSLTATAAFASQLIFPPPAGADGMSVGLPRTRFLGTWPEFRAVLIGPSAGATGREGADTQLLPYSGPPIRRSAFTPRWVGLDGPSLGPPAAHDTPGPAAAPGALDAPGAPDRPELIALGRDPFGDLVTWDTTRDGPVLTIRGSPRSGRSTLASRLSRSAAQPRCHDDAHLAASPDAIDLLDGSVHVLTLPLRHSLGYGSALAKAAELGPLLILGAHTRQDLGTLGLPRLPPLDGAPGVGWFITGAGARAVQTFTQPADETVIPAGLTVLGADPRAHR